MQEQILNHSMDKVWNAISKHEEISSWSIRADLKAEPGYYYTFAASEEQTAHRL